MAYLLVLLDEDLHHNVLELQIHDGRHGFLLGSHQCGAKHHAQVGYGHQVLLTVVCNTGEHLECVRHVENLMSTSLFLYNC